METVIIAAVGSNGVIGVENRLPWRIPEDMARFKSMTMGQSLVMGRSTYESIGRPLPGRLTIVLTRNPDWRSEGVTASGSLEAALEYIEDDEYVEVTPKIIRLRKIHLSENARRRAGPRKTG